MNIVNVTLLEIILNVSNYELNLENDQEHVLFSVTHFPADGDRNSRPF